LRTLLDRQELELGGVRIMAAGTPALSKRRVLHLLRGPRSSLAMTAGAKLARLRNKQVVEVTAMRLVALGASTLGKRLMHLRLLSRSGRFRMTGSTEDARSVFQKRREAWHMRVVAGDTVAIVDRLVGEGARHGVVEIVAIETDSTVPDEGAWRRGLHAPAAGEAGKAEQECTAEEFI
jgi:hypothetical protein